MDDLAKDFSIQMLEASPVTLVVVDEEGVIRFVNREFEKVFGYSPNRIIGKSLECIIPNRFRPTHSEKLQQILETASTLDLGQIRLLYGLRSNGEEFPIQIRSSVMRSEDGTYAILVVTDLLERMSLPRKELTVQQRYEMSVIRSSDGIWDWFNVEQEAQWWSPKFFENLGYQHMEIEPTWSAFKSLLHPEDCRLVLDSLEKHLEKNLPLQLECRMKSKVVGYRWFRIKGRANRNEDGKPTRLLGTASDIDKRKVAEIEKEQLKEFLAEKERLASIGEIVAGVTHHIKNILGGMISSMRIIEMALEENDLHSVKKAWKHYSRTSTRLSNFANEVLSLTRNPVLESQPRDLVQIVKDVIEDCSDDANVKSVSVRLHAYRDIPFVTLDNQGISDALLNLIGNAIDAASGKPHGMVKVTIRPHLQKKSVEIIVTDNGPGIPESIKETIYQPFFSSKSGQSSGLGLPMAKKVVLDHHGEIEFESAPGRTTFRVTLPVHPENGIAEEDPRLRSSQKIFTPLS
ncbi:MAG: PAS domain S-box protein [Candidatus Omnitrophica bacterium]|nr:PAS domain S-box protein [Candidatus Omnitrophota bacterium]